MESINFVIQGTGMKHPDNVIAIVELMINLLNRVKQIPLNKYQSLHHFVGLSRFYVALQMNRFIYIFSAIYFFKM